MAEVDVTEIDWYVAEPQQCQRCQSGNEPIWSQDGYRRKSYIVKSIHIETTGLFASALPQKVVELMQTRGGWIPPQVESKSFKTDLVLCDGCWKDFEVFMKAFTNT